MRVSRARELIGRSGQRRAGITGYFASEAAGWLSKDSPSWLSAALTENVSSVHCLSAACFGPSPFTVTDCGRGSWAAMASASILELGSSVYLRESRARVIYTVFGGVYISPECTAQ